MKRHKNRFGFLLVICSLFLLSGCAAVGLTLFGVGAGVATGTSVSYTLDGIAYRTFTATLPQVETATRTALDRMGIKVEATSKTEQGKALLATGNDREIEIEFENMGRAKFEVKGNSPRKEADWLPGRDQPTPPEGGGMHRV